jgi:hypothetical protein
MPMFKTRIRAAATMFASALCCFPLIGCGEDGAAEAQVSRPGEPAARLAQCPSIDEIRASQAVRDDLWKQKAALQPICLYVAASGTVATDPGRAKQFFALAKVRMQYDYQRCAGPIAGPTSSAMAAIRISSGDALTASQVFVQSDEIMAQALDNAVYDYPVGHLQEFCGGAVKPEAAWPAEREAMQAQIKALQPADRR